MTRNLHAYAYLDRPYDQVRLAFSSELVEVLEHAGEAAATRAVTVSHRLAAHLGPLQIGTRIDVEPTGFEQTPRDAGHPSCRLHLTWKASTAQALFPTMQADIVAHAVGPDETQLALFGTYSPPLGALGSVADAVLGHRVAEASVHSFLNAVVTRLEALIPSSLPKA